MGKRRETKADLILNEARSRLDSAQIRVAGCQRELSMANEALGVHQEVYDALKSQLVPTPRKVKDPKSPASGAGKRSSRNKEKTDGTANTETVSGNVGDAQRCAICFGREDIADHDPNVDGYHIFRTKLAKKGEKIVLPDKPEDFDALSLGAGA